MKERQPTWDKYEAAILLDALVKFKEGRLSKNEAVKKVSSELRQMAVNNGIKIDEIYRNENGIKFQMCKMESAYNGETTSLSSTQLFSDVVNLYRNSRAEYEKILSRARGEISIDNKKVTYKEKFFQYLAEKVSPAQLSALYDCYAEIESFCTRMKVLNTPLFETDDLDTLNKVKKLITTHKVFAVTHRKTLSATIAAISHYITYIEAVKADANNKSKSNAILSSAKPEKERSSNIEEPAVLASAPNSEEDLEEKVREVLKAESSKNVYGTRYGTTVLYIQSVLKVPAKSIQKILNEAKWAEFKFGKYVYAPLNDETCADPLTDLILKTDKDREYYEKFPEEYKKLFYFMQERLKRISASAETIYRAGSFKIDPFIFEDILKNVSWVKKDGLLMYLFNPGETEQDDNITETEGNNDSSVCLVDFDNIKSFAFTSPLEFKYFDEYQGQVSTWRELYLKVVSLLFEDYPHKFTSGMPFSEKTGTRMDFADETKYSFMQAPNKIPNTNFYAETNINATQVLQKIKFLLNLCNVDYENLVIKYCPKNDTKEESIHQEISQVTTVSPEVKPSNLSDQYYDFLKYTLGKADTTCRNYVSALKAAEDFARKHNHKKAILLIDNLSEVREAVNELYNSSQFKVYNSLQHNAPSAAINNYLKFLINRQNDPDSGKEKIAIKPKYQNAKIERVLLDHFSKGFRLNSAIDIRKFKGYYSEDIGENLDEDDDNIIDEIRKICIRFDDKAYLPEVVLSEQVKEKLLSYIYSTLASGTPAIYITSIFNRFSDDFLYSGIHSPEMLHTYLAYINDGRYYLIKNMVASTPTVKSTAEDEVRLFMKEKDTPVSYEELYNALPHIPQDKIRAILGSRNEFIWNGIGEFFHVSIASLSEEDLDNISEIIQSSIDELQYISGNELYDAIKAKYPYIIENNTFASITGLRKVLEYYLSDKFDFNGNFISRHGSGMTAEKVFESYCKSKSHFTVDELKELKKNLGTEIYLGAVYSSSLRINQNEFVSRDNAAFKIAETDEVLDILCPDKYIPISSVTNFSIFPEAGFPWNEYLLGHYVDRFSKKYKLLSNGYGISKCTGAIVRRDSGINTFNNLLIDILANCDVKLERESALQFLCEEGYISRRKYSDIQTVLIYANEQRNRKKAQNV